jgi:hypothetical protein
MKKLISLALVAVMILTLSSSAIFAAPKNNNQNAAANKGNIENREQIEERIRAGEGLPYGLAKRANSLPPGLEKKFAAGIFPFGLLKMMDRFDPIIDEDMENLEKLMLEEKYLVMFEDRYDAFMTTQMNNKLIVLIADIQKYTDEDSVLELTDEIFEALMDRVAEFRDPKYVLELKVEEAEWMLANEDEDDYLPGTFEAFEEAYVEAALVSTSGIVQVKVYENQVEKLENAIQKFMNNELASTAQYNALVAKYNLLVIELNEQYLSGLKVLINRIEPYVEKEKVLTVGVYENFMEIADYYLD